MVESPRFLDAFQKRRRKRRLRKALNDAVMRIAFLRHKMVQAGMNVRHVKEVQVIYSSDADAWCWRQKDGSVVIGVADWLLLDLREFWDETFIHELVHAVKWVRKGHGKSFLAAGKRAEALFGIKVEAYTSPEMEAARFDAGVYPYVIRCTKCGRVHMFWRRNNEVSSLLEDETSYACGECGGPLRLDRHLSRCLPDDDE